MEFRHVTAFLNVQEGGGGLSKMLAICNKVPPPPIRAWVNEVVILTQRTSKFYK